MIKQTSLVSRCPINNMLEVIGAKWTVEILRELALKPTRTRKFVLHIPGLSMKTLCRRLQLLEAAGLIDRHDYQEKPMRVEYSLTMHGQELCNILDQLKSLQLRLNENSLRCKCSIEKLGSADPCAFSCPHRRTGRNC